MCASAALTGGRPLTLPPAGRDVRRGWPHPRPVSTPKRPRRGMGHGAGAASNTADSPTRKGRPLPGPAPVCGPLGGPNKGRVDGARNLKSGERARSSSECCFSLSSFFECLFSPQESRFWCGPVHSNASVERPYSGLVKGGSCQPRCPPPSAAPHSGRQCGSVPLSGSRTGVSPPTGSRPETVSCV